MNKKLALLISCMTVGSFGEAEAHTKETTKKEQAQKKAEENKDFTRTLTLAYTSNPQMLGARKKLESAMEAHPQVTAGWRPQIGLEASSSFTKIIPDDSTLNSITPGAKEANSITSKIGVSAQQNIFNSGATISETQKVEYEIEAARATLLKTEQEILSAAALAYQDLLKAEQQLEATVINEKSLKNRLEEIQANFDVGTVTLTDLSATQASYAESQAKTLSAQAALEAAKANYQSITGEVPPKPKEAPNLRFLPKTLEEAKTLAEKHNPDYIAAKAGLKATQSGVEVAEASLMPKLDLQAGYERNVASLNGSISGVSLPGGRGKGEIGNIRAVFSIPLYEAGTVRSKIRQATLGVGEAKYNVEATRRGVDQAIRSQWAGLEAARKSIVAAQDQEKAAKIALEGATLENEVGTQTTNDVLLAQSRYLQAQLALIDAKNSYAKATYNILSTMGQMTAKNLKLSVDFYDPMAKYDEITSKWF